jgi:hypothetical protein
LIQRCPVLLHYCSYIHDRAAREGKEANFHGL